MNHALVPDHGNGTTWRESTPTQRLDEDMSIATVLFATTHGEAVKWRAAHTDEITYSPAYSNEVKTYVTTRPGNPRPPREAPDYTLALLYACETLNNSNNNPTAFQLLPPIGSYADKGYLGFTSPVDYQLYYPSSETLDKHVEKLFDHLKAGVPLEQALIKTQNSPGEGGDNDYKRPKTFVSGGDGRSLKMVLRGDPYTRLVNVCLNASEWASVSQGVRDSCIGLPLSVCHWYGGSRAYGASP